MRFVSNGKLETGYTPMVSSERNREMQGLDFGVLKLVKEAATDRYSCRYNQETLFTLIEGSVKFVLPCRTLYAERRDCFHEGPSLLHVPAGTDVEIICESAQAELTIARTENPRQFEVEFYTPEDCEKPDEERGKGTVGECATRRARVFFTRKTRPEANLYAGEVVHYPGRWSGYPPHIHEEAELYYYRFLPENGYGLAEYGEDAFKVKNHDLMGMPSWVTHSQAAAPGYAEYYQYVIRLKDDQPFSKETADDFQWVTDPEAKFFPEI